MDVTEDIRLREINQTQKENYYTVSLTWGGRGKCLGERIKHRRYAEWRHSLMVECLPCPHKWEALASILSTTGRKDTVNKNPGVLLLGNSRVHFVGF